MKCIELENLDNFVPITLEITIESKDELYELWHRLNISLDNVRECSDATTYCPNYPMLDELMDKVDYLRAKNPINERKSKKNESSTKE